MVKMCLILRFIFAELVLVHGSLVNNDYQQKSQSYIHLFQTNHSVVY